MDTSISPLSLFFPSRYLSLLLKIKRTYPNGVGNLSPNFVIILEQRERTSLRDEDFAARGFHRSPAKIFPRYCALRNRRTPKQPLFRLQKSYLWFSLWFSLWFWKLQSRKGLIFAILLQDISENLQTHTQQLRDHESRWTWCVYHLLVLKHIKSISLHSQSWDFKHPTIPTMNFLY